MIVRIAKGKLGNDDIDKEIDNIVKQIESKYSEAGDKNKTEITIVTDIRDNSGQLQKKTQVLTFEYGRLILKSTESEWTNTIDI